MPLLRDYIAEHERATNYGGEAVRPLDRGEHGRARELDALLESVDLSDPDDQDRLRKTVFDLHEHIAKKEDGLFPASLTALDGDAWDAAMAAWSRRRQATRKTGYTSTIRSKSLSGALRSTGKNGRAPGASSRYLRKIAARLPEKSSTNDTSLRFLCTNTARLSARRLRTQLVFCPSMATR
jgi:hypothetical protein